MNWFKKAREKKKAKAAKNIKPDKKKDKAKNSNWVKITIKVIVVELIIIIFVVVPSLIILFPYNSAHDLFLEYLSVIAKIASWPLAILILVSIFIVLFFDQIAQKILDITGIDLFRGKVEMRKDQNVAKPIESEEMGTPATRAIESRDLERILEASRKFIGYERINKWIYKSQYQALRYLQTMKVANVKVPKELINNLFYKEVYLKTGGNKSYVFDLYLNFLLSWNLIRLFSEGELDLVEITDDGINFIEYFISQGFSEISLFQV